MAHNSEDTARSRPRSMKWVRAPPQPVRSRDKSSDHCGQCPPVSHGGDGGQASVWLLLSQDNADIPKRRIWCRETTLRNTHLGPVLSAGQGSQVRTGKSEGGKGFRRRGPDSSCSHPTRLFLVISDVAWMVACLIASTEPDAKLSLGPCLVPLGVQEYVRKRHAVAPQVPGT